ncbi:MAG: hypothetical protein ACLQNE_40870 [Thermoguttaceae bacterium]
MNRQLLLVVVGMLVGGSCIWADDAKVTAKKKTNNEFAGKIVIVLTTNQTQFVLENAKVIKKGGESFLTGTDIKRDDAAEGLACLPCGLNLRFVLSYVSFTPEQWKTRNGLLHPLPPPALFAPPAPSFPRSSTDSLAPPFERSPTSVPPSPFAAPRPSLDPTPSPSKKPPSLPFAR